MIVFIMAVYCISELGGQMCIVTLVFQNKLFEGKAWYSIIKTGNALIMIRISRGCQDVCKNLAENVDGFPSFLSWLCGMNLVME